MSPFARLICREVSIVFVYSVVGQVYEGVIESFQFVLLCGKAAQTILMNEDSQGLDICH